jgi:hypothetical protein
MAMIDWRRRSKESTQYLVEDYVSGHIVQCGNFWEATNPNPLSTKSFLRYNVSTSGGWAGAE